MTNSNEENHSIPLIWNLPGSEDGDVIYLGEVSMSQRLCTDKIRAKLDELFSPMAGRPFLSSRLIHANMLREECDYLIDDATLLERESEKLLAKYGLK